MSISRERGEKVRKSFPIFVVALIASILAAGVLPNLPVTAPPITLPPDLRDDPRAAAALADPRVSSLILGKKFRVVYFEEFLPSKYGVPSGSAIVEIFDYTDNFGIGALVTPALKVVDVYWPYAIGINPVEQEIAYAIVKLDPRFEQLRQGRNYSLLGVLAYEDAAPICATQRCVQVHVNIYNPPPTTGGVFALFVVSLLSDSVVSILGGQDQ